eukprot:8705264-Karenia_brevis.AAC.1
MLTFPLSATTGPASTVVSRIQRKTQKLFTGLKYFAGILWKTTPNISVKSDGAAEPWMAAVLADARRDLEHAM